MQIDILMCKLCYPWCIKHQRDISALSAVYQVYRTGGPFEVWPPYEINIFVSYLQDTNIFISPPQDTYPMYPALAVDTHRQHN